MSINFSKFYVIIIKFRNAPMEKRIDLLSLMRNFYQRMMFNITIMRHLRRIRRMRCLDIRDLQRPLVDDVRFLLFVGIREKMSVRRLASIGMSGLVK